MAPSLDEPTIKVIITMHKEAKKFKKKNLSAQEIMVFLFLIFFFN